MIKQKGFLLFFLLAGCVSNNPYGLGKVIPAEEFTNAVHSGEAKDYSFHRVNTAAEHNIETAPSQMPPQNTLSRAQFRGDPHYLNQGLQLKDSAHAPSPHPEAERGAGRNPRQRYRPAPIPPRAAMRPPGSSSPYLNGQMRSNPSLWPDEAQGAFLFTDHRAFQAMDVITIVINENTKGSKKAETDTKSEFDLLAGITEFFGIETKEWAANNTSLDPTKLVQASTETEFKGEGETKRDGTLSGQISAVIMEVLPNGLFRLEGTKIVSLNSEEEILVISGLVRARDITSQNRVDSSRVANMRIDFYGRGVINEQQTPGWGARIFELVWPF